MTKANRILLTVASLSLCFFVPFLAEKNNRSELLSDWQKTLSHFDNCAKLEISNPHGPSSPATITITDKSLIMRIKSIIEKQKYKLKKIPGIATTSDWTDIHLYDDNQHLLETLILWGGDHTTIYPNSWNDGNHKLTANSKLIQEVRNISGIGDPFEDFYNNKEQ